MQITIQITLPQIQKLTTYHQLCNGAGQPLYYERIEPSKIN